MPTDLYKEFKTLEDETEEETKEELKPEKEKPFQKVLKREGWWVKHKYTRRRVDVDVPFFCGWRVLENFVYESEYLIVRALRATLFETGGRATEVLSLRKDQFNFDDPNFIEIRGMLVVKCKKGADVRWRTVAIERKDPLVRPMLEWLECVKEDEFLFSYKYGWLYKNASTKRTGATPILSGWFPHKFRAERASQLAVEKRLDVPQLMKWFGWVRPDTPMHYVRMSVEDLKAAMLRGKM